MPQKRSGLARRIVIHCGFSFSVLTCVIGLALALVLDPQTLSERRIEAAEAYLIKAETIGFETPQGQYLLALAQDVLIDGLALDSGNAQGWITLQSVLSALQAEDQASKAMALAQTLDPKAETKILYAPTRLTHVFLGEGETRARR